MLFKATILTFLLWLGTPCAGYTQVEKWESIHKSKDLEIFERSKPYLAEQFMTKAKSVVNAPYARVVKALKEIENYQTWVSRMKESKVIKISGPNTRILYMLAESPWPLTNRYYVLKTTTKNAKASFTLTMTSTEDVVIPPSDNVKGTLTEGKFVVLPLGKDRSVVEFKVDMTIKTIFPKWTFRFMHVSWIEGLFEQLTKTSQAPLSG